MIFELHGHQVQAKHSYISKSKIQEHIHTQTMGRGLKKRFTTYKEDVLELSRRPHRDHLPLEGLY